LVLGPGIAFGNGVDLILTEREGVVLVVGGTTKLRMQGMVFGGSLGFEQGQTGIPLSGGRPAISQRQRVGLSRRVVEFIIRIVVIGVVADQVVVAIVLAFETTQRPVAIVTALAG